MIWLETLSVSDSLARRPPKILAEEAAALVDGHGAPPNFHVRVVIHSVGRSAPRLALSVVAEPNASAERFARGSADPLPAGP